MNDRVICTKKASELEGFRSQISTHFYEHVCVLKHLLVLGGADKFCLDGLGDQRMCIKLLETKVTNCSKQCLLTSIKMKISEGMCHINCNIQSFTHVQGHSKVTCVNRPRHFVTKICLYLLQVSLMLPQIHNS